MEQPKKSKSKFTYDALFEKLAKEDSFKNLERNKKEQNLILNNAFNTEQHQVDFDSSNQDYLKGDENPYLNQFADMSKEDPYNEIRADNQSGWSHLGIGATRTVAKAATEVLKLPGVIGGIGIMAADGLTGGNLIAENEGFETAFNNQWIKFFDGLNEDVKEAMPVYVKESVKNGDFFTKIGSSATWATEGADGAGYMLGALAPGGLFKYFGGAAKLFGASAKAAKLGTFGKSMEAGRKALKAAGITTKNIDQYMIPAFNTIAEAGAESKGVWDGMESRKGEAITNFKMTDPEAVNLNNAVKNGLINEDEYNSQMQELMDNKFEPLFKEQKALAAQNTFFKNAVVLAGPNYIQAKLLFGKTPSKVLLDKIGGLTEKSIKNTVKQGVKNFAKGFASEGAEEVGQSAVEHRNIEEGLKFKLGDDRGDDYNPLTFGDDFIKTLGTTEGQMAGFLGGIMGAPMSSVGGYLQDKSDRIQTERLREKINGASTAYADIKNTNIYEQEEYTNPETGEVGFRDKEVDGKKVFIPENVAKVKKALDLIEKDSNEYDNAVEDGDVEKIEQFRNRGEFNVIANFIGEDEVTLDALHEHLKVAFPTENSKDISDEQVKVNKTNLERIDKIMSKAKSLQKDFVSFKDMSASILRINHPDITKDSTKEEKESAKKHLEDFLNRVGNTFLSERAEEYEAKEMLSKLKKKQQELLADLPLEDKSFFKSNFQTEEDSKIFAENKSKLEKVKKVDTDINGFNFETDEEVYKNNPRLNLLESQIKILEKKLRLLEGSTNSKIWNNKFLNKQFTAEVEERKQIKEDNSPEQVAKNDEVITAVKSSTTEDEVAEIEKTAPKSTVKNPVIKDKIDNKKAEIIQAEKVKNAEEIATATQEDNDFNDTTGYSDLNGTEGSIITDDLIPKEAENNTVEERNAIKNGEVLTGKGAQVISTNMETGKLFSFVSKDYLNYERNPINKAGKEVGFEINQLENNNSTLEIEKRREKELKERIIYDRKPTSEDGEFRIIGNPSTQIFRINENTGRLQIKDLQSGLWTVEGTHGKIELETAQRNGFEKIKEKINAKYDSEIKNLPQTKSKVNPKVKEALDAFNRGDFSNPKLLIDYLPINVTFEKGVKAPMETRRANGKLDSKKDKDGKDQFYINPATEILRSQIINHLVNGGSINDIKTTIQDQYKGLLKVDDNRFANNNILELDGVKDLKYVRDNLYVVDSFGNLMNIQTGKTKPFSNGKVKPNAKGEIYLSIPQANGKPFPLKLNIKKISEGEAVLLYEIYKEIITNEKSLNTTISETNPELQEAILTSFEAELNIIGGNKNDIKLQEIVDLLIYQSDNIKSRMQIDNGVLYFGENEANIDTIEESQNAIINYLVDSKRHQIKINPKFATDNTKTNLKSNSADYLKYLIDNNILSTNAVVNEPTFQGYTNIYLNTGVVINNQVKPDIKAKKILQEIPRRNISFFVSGGNGVGHQAYPSNKTTSDYDIRSTLIKLDGFRYVEHSDNTISFHIPYKGLDIREGSHLGIAIKNLKLEQIDSKSIKQVIDKLGDALSKIPKNITGDERRIQIEKIGNEVIDTELKVLKQPKISESGVEVTADDMGLAGAFDTAEMGGDVLDILKEFETEPKVENKVLNKIKGFVENKDDNIINLNEQNTLINIEFDKNANLSNYLKSIKVVPLKSYLTEKVNINPIQLKIVNRANFEKINENTIIVTTSLELKSNSSTITPVKITLSGDKVKLFLDKVTEANIARDDYKKLGFKDINEAMRGVDASISVAAKKLNQIVKDSLDKLLENNQENVRNVQESFVSLSEIKGTVENTQLNETQAEVFNDNKIPLLKDAARMAPIIEKYKESLKEGGKPLNARDKARINKWAEENPDAYNKIC